MLRGSSFLLQKDYRVHIGIIKELFKPVYENLWNIIKTLRDLYREKRENIKEIDSDISDTLITKILLGTMGRVPAYDEYFKEGVSRYNISSQSLSESSIIGLAKYYEENENKLENIRYVITQLSKMEYPQMKILDMAFWQLGIDYKKKGVLK